MTQDTDALVAEWNEWLNLNYPQHTMSHDEQSVLHHALKGSVTIVQPPKKE